MNIAGHDRFGRGSRFHRRYGPTRTAPDTARSCFLPAFPCRSSPAEAAPADHPAARSRPRFHAVPERAAGRLEAAGQVRADTYDLLAQLGSVIAAVLHEVYGYPLRTAVYAGQAYRDDAKGAEAARTDLAKKVNPLVARHARGNTPSPVTRQYLATRCWKKIGGSVVQAAGNLSSLSPTNLHVNVPGAAYHGQATLSTVAHMAATEALALHHGPDQDLPEWIAVVRIAKATKLAIRGGQLLGAVIPAASLPTGVVAAAAKAGVKMTYAGACFAAAKLHFHAYLERHANA